MLTAGVCLPSCADRAGGCSRMANGRVDRTAARADPHGPMTWSLRRLVVPTAPRVTDCGRPCGLPSLTQDGEATSGQRPCPASLSPRRARRSPNGSPLQFTATGTYSDATTVDLTSSVTLASATPGGGHDRRDWPRPRGEPGHEHDQRDPWRRQRQHLAHRRETYPGPLPTHRADRRVTGRHRAVSLLELVPEGSGNGDATAAACTRSRPVVY
jgi:hypothetical protein